MDKDKLRELTTTLTEERDALIQQVNARIAFLNGKIEMIQELLREAKDDDATE